MAQFLYPATSKSNIMIASNQIQLERGIVVHPYPLVSCDETKPEKPLSETPKNVAFCSILAPAGGGGIRELLRAIVREGKEPQGGRFRDEVGVFL